MTGRARALKGGYVFRHYPGQAREECVRLELPVSVRVALAHPGHLPLEPSVSAGDTVQAGQAIARDDNRVCSPVIAPISGRVESIGILTGGGCAVPAVTIVGDGNAEYARLDGYTTDWKSLPVEKLEEFLYLSGVAALGTEGIPTRFRTSHITPERVEDVIVHWTGADVYNLAIEALAAGDGLDRLTTGVEIIARVLSRARIHVVLSRRKQAAFGQLERRLSATERVRLYRVEPKYPQGRAEMLMATILGREFPHGHTAAHAGVVVLDIQAVQHAYDAVVTGKPLIERTIALSGPAFKDNLHVRVRIGTPVEAVVAGRLTDSPHQLVLNSLIAGETLADRSRPVDATFSQVVAIPKGAEREFMAFARPGPRRASFSGAFLSALLPAQREVSANLHGEERPCIQCGYCVSVCPVRILPAMLDRLRKVRADESLMRYGVFRCIDCNLCTMVCPSKIPLARNLKDVKASLVETGCDVSRCVMPKYDLRGMDEYKGVKVTR